MPISEARRQRRKENRNKKRKLKNELLSAIKKPTDFINYEGLSKDSPGNISSKNINQSIKEFVIDGIKQSKLSEESKENALKLLERDK